jgi:hypothetical protein
LTNIGSIVSLSAAADAIQERLPLEPSYLTDAISPGRHLGPRCNPTVQRPETPLLQRYADFRCDLAAGFFAAVSFAGFFPAIGISISF